MRRRSLVMWILIGVGISLVLPTCGTAVAYYLIQERLPHQPLHSLLEAAGGLMALAIAGILIAEQPRKKHSEQYTWMASGLISMGVLDLFHAAVEPGAAFVWLHSSATFFGGLFFAGVWLRRPTAHSQLARQIPWLVLMAFLAFGIISLLDIPIPPMTDPDSDGAFTLWARGLNIGGGIFFIVAGSFFVLRFHRLGEMTDWLFAAHTVLFGAAGILFEFSMLWDGAWWWWHILRLLAYLAALVYAIGAYLDAEGTVFSLYERLQALNEELENKVRDRTAKLQESEERYALAVQGSTDGLWDWIVTTDKVFYTPRFKELLGFEDHEFPSLFSSFESRLHADDLQPTLTRVRAHLESQEPYDVEYRLQCKTGEFRWFRARAQACWDEQGSATRMSGSITDITARKEAEARLKREQFLFHTLFEHLPDAIYFKDKEGRFMRVTTALALRLGASGPKDVIGKTDADFFDEAYAAQTRKDELELMRTGEPILGKEEQPNWPGQDTVCWVLTTKVPLRDENDEIIGTFGVSHDITSHKLAEERFRRIVEAAPNAILAVDEEGCIALVNAATERMFGYARDELIGQHIELIIPEEFRDGHVALRDEYLRSPRHLTSGQGRELSGRRKDGSILPVDVGLCPIEFEGKMMVLCSVQDMTEAVMVQETLLRAKEAAEGASEAKSDFLANMSHEIRTPMNAIIGMTELVLESDIDATQREYLNIVEESAESLMSIINQILDFSKIEAGRLELEQVNFDLIEEIGDTMKSLGHRAHAKHLELAWQIQPEVPRYLLGDPVRLRQVIVNLVGNAIKFTEEGEVVLNVNLTARQDSSLTLQFTVRDTGIGIPHEKQEQVFDAFAQADSSTTREHGGTGLGLAIAARIVDLMHGKLTLSSALGEGSVFSFSATFQVGVRPKGEPEQFVELNQFAAVIVDDNETNRKIFSTMLRNWGMQVSTASTAKAAIVELERLHANDAQQLVLISDVQMPSMDGFMLAAEVRDHPQIHDVAIILLTSGGRTGDFTRAEELGVIAYLMKPLKQSELLNALQRALGIVAESADGHLPSAVLPVRPLKVLLVEDGSANQVLAKAILTTWGHEVTIVENGLDAVEAWRLGDFDLVLMDVQLPLRDGLEATRRIREIEAKTPGTSDQTPIVAITARAMKGDRERCLQAGMDGYVTKPFRRKELQAVIWRFFPPHSENAETGYWAEPEATSTQAASTDAASPEEPASNAVSSPRELIDWEEAKECMAGDKDILREVAEAAAHELPVLIGQATQALLTKDLATAQLAVHTIKSSARILAAESVRALANEAEQAAIDDDIVSVTAACEQLQILIPQVVQEVSEFLKTRPN